MCNQSIECIFEDRTREFLGTPVSAIHSLGTTGFILKIITPDINALT
jgi:hypothetical protein